MTNRRRVAAFIALAGAVLGAASVGGFATGAYAMFTADPPRSAEPVAVSTAESAVAEVVSTPLLVDGDESRTGVDPMSPAYNPAVVPGDPGYLTDAMLAEWYGRQQAVQECMASRGQPYLLTDPRFADSPQPKGLSFEQSIDFLKALYGDDIYNPTIGGGCAGAAQAAADDAAKSGRPLAGDVPPFDASRPTPRQEELAFEDVIRRCMTEKGQTYLYVESWNPAYDHADPTIPKAMPDGLTDVQRAQWNAAVFGDPGSGPAYRWQDAGCDGAAVHAVGNDNMH